MSEISEYRLNSLDKRLEKIVTSLETLVSLEARHEVVAQHIDRVDIDLAKKERRLVALEAKVNINTMITGAAERFFWICATAAVGFLTYLFR